MGIFKKSLCSSLFNIIIIREEILMFHPEILDKKITLFYFSYDLFRSPQISKVLLSLCFFVPRQAEYFFLA